MYVERNTTPETNTEKGNGPDLGQAGKEAVLEMGAIKLVPAILRGERCAGCGRKLAERMGYPHFCKRCRQSDVRKWAGRKGCGPEFGRGGRE